MSPSLRPLLFIFRLFTLHFLALMATLSNNAIAEAFPAALHFERLSAEHGFSVGSVEAIHQDSKGYMWFGGPDGLTQYNGYNFTTYRNKSTDKQSLSSNGVWAIFEDRQGVLWISTDGGVNRFERNTATFTRFQHDKNNPNGICGDITRNIEEDRNGNLWIATFTGLARLDAQRKNFTCYTFDPANNSVLQSNEISRIYIDRSEKLWIGTEAGQLYSMDLTTNSIEVSPYIGSGPHRAIVSIFEDRDGLLWVGTDGNGISRINNATGETKHFIFTPNNPNGISHSTVKDIAEDDHGNLWLATERGLDLLNRNTLEFAHYVHNPVDKASLGSSTIRSLFVDSNRDLWVGNFPTGVNYLDTSNLVFKTYRRDANNANTLAQSSVLAIKEDVKGNLWFGTDGGGLSYYNRRSGFVVNYLHNPNDPQSVSAPAILDVEEDFDGTLWLGTWQGGLNHFDPVTGKVLKVYHPTAAPGGIGSDNVWSIFRDSKNNLWISTIGGGLNRYNRDADTFTQYREQPDGLPATVFWSVYEDQSGQIWAASDGLAKYNPEKDNFSFYKNDPENPESISSNAVLGMTEDKQKRLWVATRGGGLNMLDPATGKFTHITEADGLHSDIVTSIETDNDGNLWLGSPAGLIRFNPQTLQFIYYNEKNGLQGDHFNIGASLKTKAGEMVVGGTKGFTIFDPSALKINKHIPQVAIVDFQIFNKPVIVGAAGSPLTKHISETDSITLDYHQSVFSFSFVAMSYRNSAENKFAYMLEGFEKKWNYVGSDRRNATYTNLNSGTYVFRVKAANNQGLWNDTGRSITIRILPPPWKTWWAYAIYALVILGSLRWFIYAQRKQVIFLEEKVRERTGELEQKHHQLEDAYTQLEAISLSDPLTGLSNRRYLQKLIPMDIVKVQREYSSENNIQPARKPSLDFTFLLLDIDFFKPVNDIYGHMAGDQLLIQMSQLLTKICRESDCLVRWGGEEFLIVSRFASRDEAPLMAERIRESIAQYNFVLADGTVLHKTCSIGYACFPFLREYTSALSWEQVIDIADHALYAAKRSGRNRSVGLAATETTPSDQLYEHLSRDLKGMIERKELRVISTSDDDLLWG